MGHGQHILEEASKKKKKNERNRSANRETICSSVDPPNNVEHLLSNRTFTVAALFGRSGFKTSSTASQTTKPRS